MTQETRADRGYHVLNAAEKGALTDDEREFAYAVHVGLSEQPKRLPSHYFYDDEGSRVFQQIMALPEYYLTRCEQEIIELHKNDLADLVANQSLNVVDLGAGDGKKTRILLEHFVRRSLDFRYVPIDISEGAMQELVATTRREQPKVPVQGLVAEYTDGLRFLTNDESGRKNLVLFLGSNIGNFDRARARSFLRRVWSALQHGDYLLCGFDLKKDIDVLLRAYADAGGVTARFNLNLLNRINRELGGRFDTEKFRHHGTYNVFSGAMESYLVSLERQSVPIDALRLTFEFDPWEPIHTEYSYKYLRTDVATLARDTGFSIEAEFFGSEALVPRLALAGRAHLAYPNRFSHARSGSCAHPHSTAQLVSAQPMAASYSCLPVGYFNAQSDKQSAIPASPASSGRSAQASAQLT